LSETHLNFSCSAAGVVLSKAPVKVVRVGSRPPPPLNATGEISPPREPSPSVIRLVEGRPATLRCTAVGGYPPPRLQLAVADRVDRAWPGPVTAASRSVLGDGGERGLRAVAVTSWRWTVDYRARPGDDGALLRCLAVVPGLAAVVGNVKLSVDC